MPYTKFLAFLPLKRSIKAFQLAIVLLEHNQVNPDVMPTCIEQRYLSINIAKIGFDSSSVLCGGQGIENFLHVIRFHCNVELRK